MRTILMLGVASLGIVALFLAAVWAFQERIAFQPEPPPYPEPGQTRRADYIAADGQPLFAYLVGGRDSSIQKVLIAFHGNADLAVRQIPWAKEIASRTGWSVMLPEYRGYMGLQGRPGYNASRLDADAAYNFARDSLGIPDERMALFGHSMGSAIAAELAMRHRPAVLVLQSPFTSARDMARTIGWKTIDLAWGFISRLHFDTVALVAQLDAPVWVSHGANDRLIPTRMGEKVFQNSKKKGELLIVPGAAHNDVELEGGEAYWGWMTRALTSSSLSNTIRK
ncbi:MAG TPA: alpha/beta fold hydrolase [Gemmatimonadaceae bacterium]|nr:alpha/beta fold hydrolase [Gemmatimonadaceae bacterium]